MKHRELCNIGTRYIKEIGLIQGNKPRFVTLGLEYGGYEMPTIFAFGDCPSQTVRVKVSRGDLLRDIEKISNINPAELVGEKRFYLCPEGIMEDINLPDNWGLLIYSDKGIEIAHDPGILFVADKIAESRVIQGIMKREGIKSQIFNYLK